MTQATTVQGRIARVSVKPFPDNRSGEMVNLYSFQLEGKNQWFRTGQKPIPAGNGQDVKFVANGANVDMGTFAVVASTVTQAPPVSGSAAPAHAPAPASQGSYQARRVNGAGGSKDDYWANKEARDLEKEARFQAVNEPRMALSVATEAAALLVSTAIEKDAISFGNASKAKKLGLLASYTKEVALDLATFIGNAPTELANFKPSASSEPVASESNTSEVTE